MSRNDPPNVITQDRFECLRLVSIGATRDAHGAPWEPQRARLAWLRDHGLLTLDVVPPGSTAEQRRASRKVTALGRRVLDLWGREVFTIKGRGRMLGVRLNGGAARAIISYPGFEMDIGIDYVTLVDDEQIGAAS